MFIPLVEESETVKAASVIEEHPKWQKRLKHFEVGLLHGKMPPEEKEDVMTRFREGKFGSARRDHRDLKSEWMFPTPMSW